MNSARDDDEIWRAIVENYGERAQLDEEPSTDPASGQTPARRPQATEPEPDLTDDPPYDPILDAPEERYVPPPPPPLPRPSGLRGAAWIGLFGSPAVLLVCLVAGITLPRVLSWVLVASFVLGFAHLVATMPRGPRDPGDDGSRV